MIDTVYVIVWKCHTAVLLSSTSCIDVKVTRHGIRGEIVKGFWHVFLFEYVYGDAN